MKLDEAKAECERWLTHLDDQRAKASAMAAIASAVRAGRIDSKEGQRQVRTLDGSPTVYDGAKLEQAVRALLKHVN